MAAWRGFRVVHFSAQGDHLHFLVEAENNRALSEGMQGLSVRLAKGLNRMMRGRGKVFADRYHAHVLGTPSETRNALAYVLLDHRSHVLRIGARSDAGRFDRFSSAATLDGWSGGDAPEAPRVTSAPESWLLRAGWKRRGLLSPDERPGARGLAASRAKQPLTLALSPASTDAWLVRAPASGRAPTAGSVGQLRRDRLLLARLRLEPDEQGLRDHGRLLSCSCTSAAVP
jgi:hypothetical protein